MIDSVTGRSFVLRGTMGKCWHVWRMMKIQINTHNFIHSPFISYAVLILSIQAASSFALVRHRLLHPYQHLVSATFWHPLMFIMGLSRLANMPCLVTSIGFYVCCLLASCVFIWNVFLRLTPLPDLACLFGILSEPIISGKLSPIP